MDNRNPETLVALVYIPQSLRTTLLAAAERGAEPWELLEMASELDPAREWLPSGETIDTQLCAMERAGARIVYLGDETFPEALRRIPDPPMCLFLRGELPGRTARLIAVVGSRRARGNSLEFTRTLAAELSRHGVGVVSGMARGVDRAAHEGCIAADGVTVAVLGCGVDVCYPREAAGLVDRVLERGAVLSELPMGSPPEPYHFPRRNRIISGLSEGTLVVEAGRKSGALITARCAAEQGRTVMAVPGAVWNPLSAGPNVLIRDGAVPVTCADDVLEEMFGVAVRAQPRRPGPTDLSRSERAVLAALDYDTPRHLDEVAHAASLSSHSALGLLLSLEMRGLVGQLQGHRFIRLTGHLRRA